LPAAELAARLAEAYRLIGELTARAEQLAAHVERLSAQVGELERQAGKDSSTSSRPRRPTARIGRGAGTGRCVSGGNGGRPVKIQQRGSGGSWRTLEGLAEFALVQSYLSTAAKWSVSKLDALRGLFDGHAWLPSGLEPAG
jgi:hypothetical protein